MDFLIASATPPLAIGLVTQAPKRANAVVYSSTFIIAPIASQGLEPPCVRAVWGVAREQ
jgi:hypothetical protein